MEFKFFSDAGHGWLEVSKSLLQDLGITDKISSCSYERGEMAYLEEDCDAGLLLGALNSAKIPFTFHEVSHGDDSPIRRYRRWGA